MLHRQSPVFLHPRPAAPATAETFPFPEGMSPDVPASAYANDPRAVAIAEAARRLEDDVKFAIGDFQLIAQASEHPWDKRKIRIAWKISSFGSSLWKFAPRGK